MLPVKKSNFLAATLKREKIEKDREGTGMREKRREREGGKERRAK